MIFTQVIQSLKEEIGINAKCTWTVLRKYSNMHAYATHITGENIRGQEQYPLNARTSCQEI